jgi:peroxiredoxin
MISMFFPNEFMTSEHPQKASHGKPEVQSKYWLTNASNSIFRTKNIIKLDHAAIVTSVAVRGTMKKKTFTLMTVAALLVLAAGFVHAELKPGDAAPSFTLRDTSNKLVLSKAVIQGKPLLVSFYFAGCEPCKKELPEMQKLFDRHGGAIAFYLISTDKEGAEVALPFVKNLGVTIPVLCDKYSDAAKAFGVNKYPSIFIIGTNGALLFSASGYHEETIAQIDQVLGTLHQ